MVAAYEMKDKVVTLEDVDIALMKIRSVKTAVSHYVFITTKTIDPVVDQYCREVYAHFEIEVAVLDCIGFVRHFLHLFHGWRTEYLREYEGMLLAEPESAVSHGVKAFFFSCKRVMLSRTE
jgi:DNA adenine methylase